MADKRITQLNSLEEIANDDVFAIVDVDAQETKQTTYKNLVNNVTSSLPPGLGGTGLGWARYDDTQFTTGSEKILSASVEYTIPNNAGNIVDEHIHSNLAFYNSASQKVQAENEADVYVATIVFRTSASNANQTFLRVQLDSSNGTPYERVGYDFNYAKGNNIAHAFHQVFQYYADTSFVENGSQWKIEAVGGDVKIWDIIYFIQRTQNHSTG